MGYQVKLPAGSWGFASREPLGVVGGVGAWNYPLQTCTWKVAPALACGNTFVYKPSPLAPLAAVVLGEVLKDAGVPDGVYNVVQGEAEPAPSSPATLTWTNSPSQGACPLEPRSWRRGPRPSKT